jgi:hypothetical protein
MTYRTKAAEALIDHLHCEDVRYTAALEKLVHPGHDATVTEQVTAAFERGYRSGQRDMARIYVEFAPDHLERIEQEAELVPTPSAEQSMEENQMAGDLRDFPADYEPAVA